MYVSMKITQLTFMLCVLAQAQEPHWVTVNKADPVHRISFKEFTLEGKFVVAPQHSDLPSPSMVIVCQPGRHQRTNGDFCT